MLIAFHIGANCSSGLVRKTEIKRGIRAMNLKNFVSVKRAAEIHGVKPPRIIAMINNGDLTPIHYDGGYVIARAEIEGYVRKKGGKRPAQKQGVKRAKKKN
jgi:hypothetical protein